MRASSPAQQLAVLGAIALAGFAALALWAGVVEAGPGAPAWPVWTAPPDSTDSTRTADSLRAVAAFAVGDTTLADSLFSALGLSRTATGDVIAVDSAGVPLTTPPTSVAGQPCEHTPYLGTVWLDEARKLAVITVNYTGTDMCWEPASRHLVIAW